MPPQRTEKRKTSSGAQASITNYMYRMPPTRSEKKNTYSSAQAPAANHTNEMTPIRTEKGNMSSGAQARTANYTNKSSPVRTEKRDTSTGAQALLTSRSKKLPLRALPEGEKQAYFWNSAFGWNNKYERVIGTSTRSIVFGGEFVLTDDHVNDILALDSRILDKIWEFIVQYVDVSYGAKNGAETLTNEAVSRLAKSFPKLRKVQLQGTDHVTDEGMLSFFENCPGLKSVEVSGPAAEQRNVFSGSALDRLREHPEMAPKLKKLILGEWEENKPFMKAMRSLGKERPGLITTLLQRRQYKKWGDWELDVTTKSYKKGRVIDRHPSHEPKFYRYNDF